VITEDLVCRTLRNPMPRMALDRNGMVHSVVSRVMASTRTATNLAIMNELVRANLEEYDHRSVFEQAVEILASASDLKKSSECRQLWTALSERGLLDD